MGKGARTVPQHGTTVDAPLPTRNRLVTIGAPATPDAWAKSPQSPCQGGKATANDFAHPTEKFDLRLQQHLPDHLPRLEQLVRLARLREMQAGVDQRADGALAQLADQIA